MLKLYKGITPNTNNLHYYFTDFDDYLTELGNPFLQFNIDNYLINQNQAIVNMTEADAIDITYMIEERDGYYRCYNVDFLNYQTNGAVFNLSVDYWASYIAKASIDKIRVNRCNRNIGIGVYDKIISTKNEPVIEPLDRNGTLPVIYANGIVCSILYTVVGAIPNTPSCTAIRTYYFSLSKYQTLAPETANATLYDLINFVGTIYKSDAPTGSGSTADSRIINAYVISGHLFDDNHKITDTSVIPTFTGVIRYQNVPRQIDFQPDFEVSPHKFTYSMHCNSDIILNNEIFVGTHNNGMKITRTTESTININFDFIYTMSSIKVIVSQGAESYDLTQSFQIDITRNEGAESGQRRIAQAISVIGSFGALATGNLFMGTLGVASALNSALPNSNAGFNSGGDGASEFTESPNNLVARKYESCVDEGKNARLYGANFNQEIASLEDLTNYSLLGDGTMQDSYIKCDCCVNNVPTLAQNYITSKLNSGVYIKIL